VLLEIGLLLIGLVAVVGGVAWQLQVVPGSGPDLPAPVAFGGVAGVREVHTSLPAPVTGPHRGPAPAISPQREPAPPETAPRLTPVADTRPLPGVAQRLTIASIGLDTPVVAGGLRTAADGSPEWETVPDIAVHYAALTALIGAPGNAVIAGHVSTRAEGNVFINLYNVELGDEVRVWDQRRAEHVFAIASVKLVPPSDTSVMDETPDPTLTLMTCGGRFDPVRREFSDRLIVMARPA
jgi:LPXTG-site transpeptidase (sortase) family protein